MSRTCPSCAADLDWNPSWDDDDSLASRSCPACGAYLAAEWEPWAYDPVSGDTDEGFFYLSITDAPEHTCAPPPPPRRYGLSLRFPREVLALAAVARLNATPDEVRHNGEVVGHTVTGTASVKYGHGVGGGSWLVRVDAEVRADLDLWSLPPITITYHKPAERASNLGVPR